MVYNFSSIFLFSILFLYFFRSECSFAWNVLQAPWTPRLGAGLVSQFYTNSNNSQESERMIIAGGYGGWPYNNSQYTGVSCMSDVWSFNGTWILLISNASFGNRAWFTMQVYYGENTGIDPTSSLSPKIFLFSGGNIGNSTLTNKKYLTMAGLVDGYWSRDGIIWNKINYDEGGAPSKLPLYSSQEWTKTVVNAISVNLGMWAASMVLFNPLTKVEVTYIFFVTVEFVILSQCRNIPLLLFILY